MNDTCESFGKYIASFAKRSIFAMNKNGDWVKEEEYRIR